MKQTTTFFSLLILKFNIYPLPLVPSERLVRLHRICVAFHFKSCRTPKPEIWLLVSAEKSKMLFTCHLLKFKKNIIYLERQNQLLNTRKLERNVHYTQIWFGKCNKWLLKVQNSCCVYRLYQIWTGFIFLYQKSLKQTFKTGFWEQNHLLNLCSSAVNSQRILCGQKAGVKCLC